MFEMVSHFNVPSNTRPYSNFISLTVFASDPAPSKSPRPRPLPLSLRIASHWWENHTSKTIRFSLIRPTTRCPVKLSLRLFVCTLSKLAIGPSRFSLIQLFPPPLRSSQACAHTHIQAQLQTFPLQLALLLASRFAIKFLQSSLSRPTSASAAATAATAATAAVAFVGVLVKGA
ncbi:unnamed protein product [Protopolystoma xenopodis]|uniref:Uncharacterized protein n=1 Tax=Protopolystoma xenopodis TaxID=117903 RepID=A0A448XLX0_9PLAT|nr:unnamed protein product [Protopolystoma xenopodis]